METASVSVRPKRVEMTRATSSSRLLSGRRVPSPRTTNGPRHSRAGKSIRRTPGCRSRSGTTRGRTHARLDGTREQGPPRLVAGEKRHNAADRGILRLVRRVDNVPDDCTALGPGSTRRPEPRSSALPTMLEPVGRGRRRDSQGTRQRAISKELSIRSRSGHLQNAPANVAPKGWSDVSRRRSAAHGTCSA
jgi:hypothetical protein